MATEVEDVENLVTNCYEVLGIDENKVKVLQMYNDCVSKYINFDAGIGGGFMNTNKLHMMKYHEAINRITATGAYAPQVFLDFVQA